MKIQYKKDEIIKIDEERKIEIQKYIENQNKFKKLSDLNILKYFEINYQKKEINIEKITKEEIEEIKKNKDDKNKKYPMKLYSYSMWAILPNEIQNILINKIVSIDNIDTDTLRIINERTSNRIELYKNFILN